MNFKISGRSSGGRALALTFALCLILSSFGPQMAAAQRRRKTTTSTTPAPPSDLELSIADRERNLAEREENFREREVKLREREENLAAREEKLQEREDKISEREANAELREKNSLSGKCTSDKGLLNGEDAKGEELDLTQVRLYEQTQKYHEIGTNEVCGQNMRFFALPESETEGDCDCDYHQCSRPLIYSGKYAQCFWAWTQGPCEQGEWYVFNSTTLEAFCEKNPCPESLATGISRFYFQSPEDGKCYQSTTRGPCKVKGERLFWAPGEPIPSCRKQMSCLPVTIPATHECFPGNKRFQLEQC